MGSLTGPPVGGKGNAVDGWLVLAIATPVLIIASLAGGAIPGMVRHSHLRMQLALSFVSGLMLGVAVLHLMPHAVIVLNNSIDTTALLMLTGIVSVFLLMRFLHVHNVEPCIDPLGTCDHDHEPAETHVHKDAHDHRKRGQAVRWVTLLAGLSLHSIVDGAALAAAIRFELGDMIPGLMVLIVVVLHKPLDALAITAMVENDAAKRRRVNLLYALVAPVAAWLAYLGLMSAGENASVLTGYAMAFCAGAFICVALADLMPEVQFHAHHRVRLTLALAIGVGVAMLLGVIEGHQHGLGDGHDHSGHDHSGHNQAGHDH